MKKVDDKKMEEIVGGGGSILIPPAQNNSSQSLTTLLYTVLKDTLLLSINPNNGQAKKELAQDLAILHKQFKL